MKPLWILIALTLTGCANGQGRPDLPYSSWNIGLGAPSHMEVWVESVDVIDRRGLVFERVHSGTVSYTGNPVGWPKRVGGGGGKSISGVDLPEFIFVRWQSLAEPQTYNVRINIPLWVREEMLKPREVADCSRKEPRPTKIAYLSTFDIILAPGGVAKIWLTGGCLKSIEFGRFEGKVNKVGPYDGTSGGKHRPLSEESKAYIEQFGIPYGSW